MVSFLLGNMSIPTNQISDFIVHEQIDRLPYGKVAIIDRGGLLADKISLISDIRFTISIADRSHLKTFDMRIPDYVLIPKDYGYDIECELMMNSDSYKHYCIIKPSIGIKKSNSVDAIKKLLDKLSLKYVVNGNLSSSDSMNWLIVNSNIQSALDGILSRSYISDNDALLVCCKADGEFVITSVLNSLYNPSSKITHKISSMGHNNGNDKDSLIVYGYRIRNGSGSRNAVFNSNMTKTISDYSDSIVMAAGDRVIEANPTKNLGNHDIPIKQQILSYDVSYMDKHNVHKNYWKSSQVRSGVLGACSHLVECTGPFESITNIGYSSEIALLSSSEGSTIGVNSGSGTYMLIRKSTMYNMSMMRVMCDYGFVRPNTFINKNSAKEAYGEKI